MDLTNECVRVVLRDPLLNANVQIVGSSSLASSLDTTSTSSQSFPFTTGGRPPDTSLPAFKTEYHPKSGRPTRFYSYDEFRRPVQQQVFEKDEHPWRPFRSRADYDLASIAVDAQMSDSLVRRLLDLVKGVKSGEANVTFESVKNLRDACDTATTTFTPFELHDIVINYKGEDLHHEFYGRDMFDWALDLLENEALAPHFVWDAQRHYKYNGSDYVRFIDEPWSADRWWAIQEDLPKLGDHPAAPFAIVLYADKTRLSSAGNVQGYPVVARCANLPADIRNGKGSGGGYVVGWLPIVEDNSEEDGTLAYTTLERVLWHDSVRKLFENAQDSSKNGFFYEKCHDGIPRWLYFTILILSADYEEQTTMVLNRGAGGNHPCPVCLVPRKQQHDLSLRFPRRSEAETQAVVVQYNQADIDPAEKRRLGARLDELSIRPVNNIFWMLRYSDTANTISVDHLHNFHHGIYGKHQHPELLKILENTPNSRKDLGKFNSQKLIYHNRFSQQPRWRGFGHFESPSTTTFSDGNKFRDISKAILFCTYNILTPSYSPEGFKLLQLIASYLELDAYYSLEVHTEETLRAAWKEVGRFGTLLKEYIALALVAKSQGRNTKIKINWDFPKIHALIHFLNDVLQKGGSRHTSTRPNEGMHGPLKDSYENRSNGKDFAEQILRVDTHRLALLVIGERIQRQAEIKRLEALQDRVEHDDDVTAYETDNSWHVYLGSPQQPIAVQDVVSKRSQDSAFEDFELKLQDYINLRLFPNLGISLPTPLAIPETFQITEYYFFKVNYESYETWTTRTDYLRCNPSFYNHPRYDCVLAKLTPGTAGIARLVMPFDFTILFQDAEGAHPQTFSAALVQPYTAQPNVPADVGKIDDDLNFTRLKACPRADTTIISLDSVIRGALICPDFDRPDEYFVNAFVDGDMFLRMKGDWTRV
ncbi:hypothetical protein CONPUDRAFT_58076 [Coniophora puteana RWD-64-598 SS2]|uniref:Uncharacterized protein n=1 Tax=Coniophora puteana (strain RWD-64-598) TaxID=741705 RepID=A0A5M3MLX4_CONPW|nr:uncharacterized protein CONPUDRAFT_58076 [Coniophora puteana RWD-64-598 SS2]EIW80027.1 hypothetical protein CONPUDRAFT_58076 [Coniophora puteana RWD-64-598 SS2]